MPCGKLLASRAWKGRGDVAQLVSADAIGGVVSQDGSSMGGQPLPSLYGREDTGVGGNKHPTSLFHPDLLLAKPKGKPEDGERSGAVQRGQLLGTEESVRV